MAFNTIRADRAALITPVLIGSCVIVLISFAIRSSFGLFQIPVADSFGWPRAEFSLAIAIQNLAWGIGQPVFSAFADRFGDRRAIVLGAIVYALGLVLSAYGTTAVEHQLWNILIGCGIAGTGIGVVVAVVGRTAAAEHRSLSLGIVTAAASAGQIVGPPVTAWLLGMMDWSGVFLVFAGVSLSLLMFLPLLRTPAPVSRAELEESMGAVLRRAMRDPSFFLIFVGFFSCGYQLGFVTAHFPAFIAEVCGPIDPSGLLAGIGVGDTTALGALAIAVIGFTNIAGTLLAGKLGSFLPKKNLLAAIYAGRTLISAWFILTPMTPLTVLVFSAVMGSLWLATVPLTSGLVAHIWGLRYMGTLYGIVFFSHQLGSFLGVWMGGALYDRFGSYDTVWWVGVGVGLLSVIVHLPVREARSDRAAMA
ncbi:MFS transporter [Paralimibaculum aggregatum]|uniref:MFS transporter n=1 Tax=Paralimibaculum aggregatum TaxID=3036245 RepID=A0ABQ6LK17_9RHOB|nr:MFS transporter [Limibaculum sp. NKW23]GMG82524.1 MFS transporter [Limibaculum sp. NKW23]